MKHARPDYQAAIIDTRPEGEAIPEHEPVFLLRGQDKYSARVVRFWASLVAHDGGDGAIVEAALRIADDMDAWPTKKAPDLPEGS